MEDFEVLAYVNAAATALGFQLDPAAAQRVASQLRRTSAMAQQLLAFPLAPEDEPAEIYRPGGQSK